MNSHRSHYRGIALVAVLAILTILALVSVSFVVFTTTEADTSKNIVYHYDATILADAGLEHAKSLLWHDALLEEDKTDSPQDNWNTAFNGSNLKKAPEVDVDLIPNNGPSSTGEDSAWIPVYDDKNALIGRYAVLIDDECSKINLNVASIISPRSPHQGLSPREVLLGDGRNSGLPLSREILNRLLRVRYGPNNVPGARIDDNNNNSYYMEDGLDNNANGIVDELDEGVNELDEYVSDRPFGDDRALFNLQDTLSLILPDMPPTRERTALLRKYGTLVSRDSGLRWDSEDRQWVHRLNLNVSSAKELFQTLKQANVEHRFEGNSREMRHLAASMADYRDENNVLSTVSSEYGVESICFNEILANEGSKMRLPYRNRKEYGEDRRVHSLPYYYGSYDYRYTEPYQESDVSKREEFDRNSAFPILRETVTRSGNSVRLKLRDFPLSGGGFNDGFNDFKKLLKKRGGYAVGDRVIWPENIWKNGYLSVYDASQDGELPEKAFKILRSTSRNELYLQTGSGKHSVSPQDFIDLTNGALWIAHIRSWIHEKAYYAEHPQVHNWSVFSGLKPGKYYRVYIQETNLETPTGDTIGGDTYSRVLDVDGNIGRYSEKEIHRLRYPYKDGKAQRADSQGCLDVFLTSAKKCSTRKRNRFNAAYFSRPDVIELINIGNRPVSLRGWSLVANTGTLAYELGVIKGATSYSKEESGRIFDPNPVIRPNEYFYLCNNEEIFDYDFGTIQNGTWGSGAAEQMPVYEISDDTWGVRFKILNVRETREGAQQHTYVRCENEHWKKDQFKDEVAEFQTDRDDSEVLNSPDGVRYLIEGGNTRNTLYFPNLSLSTYSDIRPGDYVMIVGLPRIGGFVSMTLKNEYGQIAARLIEYGNPGEEATKDPDRWLNYSSEKPDPTREFWVLTKNPTFGGTVQKARNTVAKIKVANQATIKNGPFGSVGEVERVKRVATWEKDIREAKSVTSRNLVRGAADYFSTSGVRLDPEDDGAHIFGWKPAFGSASVASRRGITDQSAAWELNEWTNQSVHILSGKNRGETFIITGNSRDTLAVEGRSVPSRKTFYVAGEDTYGLGPGYSSAMYYTRNDTEAGEWEWKNKRIPRGSYSLYLSGLNDSIVTTEFLEENYNAKLDVYLYDYEADTYELLSDGNQYNKNDLFFAGLVQPQHISKQGHIRIKLIPHNLQGEDTSGFAWFNYAYLTPVATQGRININTAPERILSALNGVGAKLASNIAQGIDRSGRKGLKPYKAIGDLLDVDGMSIDTFSTIANMITVRSDQYNVYVLAQRIEDVDNDGQYTEGDRITATKRVRALLDRSGLYNEPGSSSIRVVEKETL
jgi:hypothetical protein